MPRNVLPLVSILFHLHVAGDRHCRIKERAEH